MIRKIEEFFYTYNFNKIGTFESDSYVIKLLIKTDFPNIFINSDESEAYIVIMSHQVFKEEELDLFERKIIGLVGYLPNTPLKYNINLVLACPLKMEDGKEISKTNNSIIRYERIKYYCRRFFLDTGNPNFEEELSMLPFSSIKLEFNLKGYEGIVQEVQRIIPNDLYVELIKDQTDFLKIKKITGN